MYDPRCKHTLDLHIIWWWSGFTIRRALSPTMRRQDHFSKTSQATIRTLVGWTLQGHLWWQMIADYPSTVLSAISNFHNWWLHVNFPSVAMRYRMGPIICKRCWITWVIESCWYKISTRSSTWLWELCDQKQLNVLFHGCCVILCNSSLLQVLKTKCVICHTLVAPANKLCWCTNTWRKPLLPCLQIWHNFS